MDDHVDPELVARGYALNKMCFSLNIAANREAFLADLDAYCAAFGLDPGALAAVRSGRREDLFAVGGNMYFVAKLERTLRQMSRTTGGH